MNYSDLVPGRVSYTDTRMVLLGMIYQGVADGQPPSIRNMMDRTGCSSPNGITQHLKQMEKDGLIKHENKSARTWAPVYKFIPESSL